MKFIGELDRITYDHEGNEILGLKVENRQHQLMINEIEKGEALSVEITKVKSKRSVEQNRLLWALLADIDKARNGWRANDELAVYTEALERAGAKYEYIACLDKAEDMLRKAFRAVQFVRVYDAGKNVNQYKCYYGSSKMTTAEMAMLIETVLDMAAECGVETAYWKGVLG